MNDTCKRTCGTEVHYFAASRFRDMISFFVSSNGIGYIKADKVEGPFINYEDARAALRGMDTDDCDYGIFTFFNGEWYYGCFLTARGLPRSTGTASPTPGAPPFRLRSGRG